MVFQQPVLFQTHLLWLKDNMEHSTKHAAQVQKDLLNRILEKNVGSEYLQKHGLHKHRNLVHGFNKLPLVEYADIEMEINRIADGDCSPVLCSDPITKFFISSGTTNGKSKLIPMTEETLNLAHKQVFKLSSNDVFLAFWFASKHFFTRGGIRAETVTTSGLNSDLLKHMAPSFVTPYPVYLSTNTFECMYCHLLSGLLRSKEVTLILSAFAFTLTEAFRMLEDLWPELLNDMITGALSPRVKDPSLRSAMLAFLHSWPTNTRVQLAKELEKEFSDLDFCWENCGGIVERIWSNAKCVTAVTTGAMLAYVPSLRGYLGNVAIVSGNYFSSESLVGVNLSPMTPPEEAAFTVNPEFAYFEFLPFCNGEGDEQQSGMELAAKTVGLTDVKVGQKYEVVVTTRAGLYRYRLGDIVRVTGFYNSSPTLAFLFRKKVVLSVATDKTDESELQEMVLKASQLLVMKAQDSEKMSKADNDRIAKIDKIDSRRSLLHDFTSFADFSTLPGHYAIFWELKPGVCVDSATLQACCQELDVSFNNPYMRGRTSGAIGPLELCVVQRGTFSALFELHVSRGGSGSQYKAPRCVASVEFVQLLRRNTVLRAFSSSEFPRYVLDAWKP